eukprot:CAMPEP_0113484734 /NCGR_PEP_ID=MMETSP0014_2-20120614/24119_1 /TAXON_ID=2857 /ORGANISM="Nitzschia sp." /LENGTH=313 /DNA_ID=CAMNT_0000378355 /DNA_START=82 /DNA_END=1023 /DNA_ORIENTATION=- /assembly_acc=CAM_ASM_000159
MAPNRKQLQHVEFPSSSGGGLEGLRSTVQSKFLPLTDSRSQEQLSKLDAESETQQQEQLQQQHQEVASYWDWNTADDAVDILDQKIQTEEEAKAEVVVDLFSASHIEANLIADAKKYALKKTPESDEPENDYHQRRRHVSVATSAAGITRKPQHELTSSSSQSSSSYWDWSINTSDYEEELAERLTSSTHVMKNLINTPYQKKNKGQEQNDDDHYWTWETETLQDEPSQQQVHNQKDSYWTWNATNVPSTLDYVVADDDDVGRKQQNKRMAESDNYWEWTTSSELDKVCDEPWVDSMKTAQAVVSSGKSYWDW